MVGPPVSVSVSKHLPHSTHTHMHIHIKYPKHTKLTGAPS